MTDNQQRAAKLWAALNVAGLDGEEPDSATVARVASAYLNAVNAAEARGRAEALEKCRQAVEAARLRRTTVAKETAR